MQQGELATLIERLTGQDGIHPTAIASLFLVRFSNPAEPLHGILQPVCCIAAQGGKQIMLAGNHVWGQISTLAIAVHCLPHIYLRTVAYGAAVAADLVRLEVGHHCGEHVRQLVFIGG